MKWLKSSIVSIVVICVIFLIIIPLPSTVLDFLLMLNLSLAVIILLTVMNIKNALEFSVFPSLLLITTLFRVSLEVSSTRLILTNNGNAGQVIKTFGQFVIQGNVLVGIVIFLIIIIVQFIVITKGSERVAEVAARFTLDAMPGKQMAIDADLNSGLITEQDARIRRNNIQRQADFYGSMDGASKFVKGDSIASIIIVVINIVGGIIVGLMAGQDIMSVLKTYTIATVGEGLLAQLPALLISTSTGIIVTRAASESNMSEEFTSQLFSKPIAMIITGVVLLVMMLMPGFPKIVLLMEGAIFLMAGIYLNGNGGKKKAAPTGKQVRKMVAANSELEKLKNPENVYQYLELETLEMEFGYSLLPLVNEAQGGTFADKVVMFRKQFALEMGVVIPSVLMRDNIQLPNNRYVIKIRGEEVAHGEVLVGSLMIMNPSSDKFTIDGVDATEPAFGLKARWIPENKRAQAELAGYTVIDPAAVMMTHLAEVIRRHAFEIIGRKEVNEMLDVVKKSNPSLVDEVIPAKISVGELEKVLQNLLTEDIPVRDMTTILETIADHAPKIKDPDMLTEFVRQNLRRTISRKFAPDGDLKVITLDPQLEKQITSSVRRNEAGAYLAMEPDKARNIIDRIRSAAEKFTKLGIQPVVLVSPVVRMYLRRMTEQTLPDLAVLSYNELENNLKVQALEAVAA